MFFFSVTEKVQPGIPINRDETPSIDTPKGCSVIVMLSRAISDPIERSEPGIPVLYRAGATLDEGVLVIRPGQPEQPWRRHPPLERALVHLGTAGGVGGKVFLRSTAFSEEFIRHEIRPKHEPFPPLGVQPLCVDGVVEAVNRGVDILDLLVIMQAGSQLHIKRTGRLEGASPRLTVRWSGHAKHQGGLSLKYPPSHADRAAGFAAGTC